MTRYFMRILAVMFLAIGAESMAMAAATAAIPSGTSVEVRITEQLNSETANVGQVFHGVLALPVVIRGKVLFPKGAQVTGEVLNVERSGRLSGPGELHLGLRTIRSGARSYPVAVRPIVIKGESHTKSNITKIGGGTAVGALIGAIAGGGKGAAIGAGVGAAAGTGVAAGTGKKPAIVETETVLAWETENTPITMPSPDQAPRQPSGESYAAGRGPVNQHSGGDDYDRNGPTGFSSHERQIISDCYVNDRAGLPPGLAKKDHLPPGLERQLQRNGTLPPGLQKRVQPLPEQCSTRLRRLPRGWSRVVLSGRIILLDPRQRIVDLFWLQN